MDISDIDKLIVSGEGNTIEFKEAQFTLPSSIYETVVSFSNTDGGTILLGIDKNGNISGIDANEVETIQKNIVSTLNSRDCINPPIYLQPIRVNHHKGIILV